MTEEQEEEEEETDQVWTRKEFVINFRFLWPQANRASKLDDHSSMRLRSFVSAAYSFECIIKQKRYLIYYSVYVCR